MKITVATKIFQMMNSWHAQHGHAPKYLLIGHDQHRELINLRIDGNLYIDYDANQNHETIFGLIIIQWNKPSHLEVLG